VRNNEIFFVTRQKTPFDGWLWTAVNTSEMFNNIIDLTDPEPEWRYIAEVEAPFFEEIVAEFDASDETMFDVEIECAFEIHPIEDQKAGYFAASSREMEAAITGEDDDKVLLLKVQRLNFVIKPAKEALLNG
jgi:hypothetical protein